MKKEDGISLRSLREKDAREPVFGLMVQPRLYRCLVCGYTRPVNTNHTDVCVDYCECSWRSGYIRDTGVYFTALEKLRPCEYVGPDVTPKEFNPNSPLRATVVLLVSKPDEPGDDITFH